VNKRTYAIIGAGAVGAFYGAKLQRAGFDVHFLVHTDFDHVCKHGMRILSTEGDILLPQVNAYSDASSMPPCDVALVALKTTQNHLLADILPRVLSEDGVALIFQNGLGLEEEIAGIVGVNRRVMGGLCFIRSNKIGPGLLKHTGSGYIILGEHMPQAGDREKISPQCSAIADDFRAAGLIVKPTTNLRVARWQKLVWNIPYNGLSVVLDAMTDSINKNLVTRSLVAALMREVEGAAAACGHPIPAMFVEEMLAYTDAMEPYTTSMKLDFDFKRPMELEAIYGNALRAGKKAGASMPCVEMLYQQLKFLDERNRG